MKLNIEKDVKAYLEKNNATCLIVDMIRDETSSGCSCGLTKKYYMPYIRIGFNQENISKAYIKHEANGIHVFFAEKALIYVQEEDKVSISLEKGFLSKKLIINGIKTVVE